jgi:hypothetical protein
MPTDITGILKYDESEYITLINAKICTHPAILASFCHLTYKYCRLG